MAESRDASDAQNDMSTSQQEPTRLAKAVVPSVIHDRLQSEFSPPNQLLIYFLGFVAHPVLRTRLSAFMDILDPPTIRRHSPAFQSRILTPPLVG
jgi:hypothetical protein